MSFRTGLAATMLLALVGCGLKLGDKAPGPTELKISGNQYSCLSQIAARVDDYVNDRMSDDQIHSFVSCVQGAFFEFSQKFHGHENPSYFAPNDIRVFLEDNFLPPDEKISDELLHQFMVIKQGLVGGAIDSISYSDLSTAIKILGQIEQEAVRMRPFIPVLNPSMVDSQDPTTLGTRINQADVALAKTVQVLGGILASSQHPYQFSDMLAFTDEFKQFLKWDVHFPNTIPSKDWVDLITAFKLATVSPGDKEIQAADWIPLTDMAYKWYLNYIKMDVGVMNRPIYEDNGFRNTVGLFDSAQDLLNRAVERQPNRMIPFEVTDRLIAALQQVGWMPANVRAQSVQEALKVLVTRVLGSDPSDNPSQVSGITKVTLDSLATAFSQWAEIQIGLQEQFSKASSAPVELTKIPLIPLLGLSHLNQGRATDRTGWTNFMASFKDYRPLFKDGNDRVFLARLQDLPKDGVTNDFFNLSRMNLLRSLMELIFKGYVGDGQAVDLSKGVPMDAFITQDALQEFYTDFRNLGIDIGLVDRRTTTAGSRTFMEAKIFTYLGDGMGAQNSTLSFGQAVQEEAFLFSGGMLSLDLYKDLLVKCPGQTQDLNGNLKLNRTCVHGQLVASLLKLIQTMPGYTAFLSQLPAASQSDYAQTLMSAAYGIYSIPTEIERSELETIAMVVHYTEAVMTRFDANGTGVLTEAEVDLATPVFSGLIETLGQKLCLWDPTPENVFKFILKYQRLPTTAADKFEILKHWGDLQFDIAGYQIGNKDTWGIQLDRMAITKVFVSIVQIMMAPTQAGSCK